MATVAELVVEAARRHGVDPRLAVEVAIAESGLNQSARGASGEIGVFQLMPATAAELGVDPYDLRQNIEGGVRYLKQQLDRFGEVAKALAAYNCGPGCVSNAVAAAGAGWLSRVPASTRSYVAAILSRLGELWQPAPSVEQMAQAAEQFRRLSREQQTVLLVMAIVLGVLFASSLVDA